jgi:hypothetical protein
MAWDPALLRKYNTTSHFRLLNQVRSELRDQPIQRPLITSRSAAASASASGSRRGGRSVESSAGAGHAVTRRRSAGAGTRPSIALPAEEHHQPIMAVPVLTGLVLPDSHTGG